MTTRTFTYNEPHDCPQSPADDRLAVQWLYLQLASRAPQDRSAERHDHLHMHDA